MSRDSPDLPPLKNLISPQTESSRSRQLISDLRRIAKSLRGDKSRRFYSVREVAAHFDCSIGTVTSAYQRLEQEGLLARIRGSKTLLVGRKLLPKTPARAVVGIVARRFSMIVNPDTRALDCELVERLSQRGYVAEVIFHPPAFNEPELVEHIVRHRVDIVLIQMPGLRIRQNLLTLRDHGIRAVTLQDSILPTDLPASIYQLNWRTGYERLAAKWRREGVRHVMMPMRKEFETERAMHILWNVFTEHEIEVHICGLEFPPLLRAIRRSHTAVAFADRFAAARICNRYPFETEKVLRRTKVAFCRGPIYVPYLSHQDVFADVVVHSATEIARKIADDMAGMLEKGDGVRHLFESDLLEKEPFEDPVFD